MRGEGTIISWIIDEPKLVPWNPGHSTKIMRGKGTIIFYIARRDPGDPMSISQSLQSDAMT